MYAARIRTKKNPKYTAAVQGLYCTVGQSGRKSGKTEAESKRANMEDEKKSTRIVVLFVVYIEI